ncbi:MAG: lipid-A-disaccharide synthase, partial [Lutibacter sp.]|nr:lipid-A-disaccharide synthase [Lutibacter sp.]
KEVVKELIQDEFNEQNLEMEFHKIIDGYQRAVMFIDYYDLEKKLGGKGASKKVAELIIEKSLK